MQLNFKAMLLLLVPVCAGATNAADLEANSVVTPTALSEITRETWRYSNDSPIRTKPLFVQGMLIFGSDDAHLTAVDAKTGKTLWRMATESAANASAAAIEQTVFTTDKNGTLYSVAVRDGHENWRFHSEAALPFKGGYDFYSSTPLLWKDRVIFGSADGRMYAVAIATGKKIWSFQTHGRVRSSPLSNDDTIVVGSADGNVYKLDAGSGQLLWKFATQGVAFDFAKYGFDRTSVQSSPQIAGGTVFVGSRDSFLYAIDFRTGKEQWHLQVGPSDAMGWVVATPVVIATQVYFASSDGQVVGAADTRSGKVLWQTPLPCKVLGSPLALADSLLAPCTDGNLYDFDLVTGALRWRYDIGAKLLASPAANGDSIVIGDDAGVLHNLSARPSAHGPRAFYAESKNLDYRWSSAANDTVIQRLLAAGYKSLDWSTLPHYLDTHWENDAGVIVMLSDHVPDSVLSSGDRLPVMRQFLNGGGKVVWTGLPVDASTYSEDDKPNGVDKERNRLIQNGPLAAELTGDQLSKPTDIGRRWGLKAWRPASWSVDPGRVDEVLATNQDGRAVAWRRKYSARDDAGFIQYWQVQNVAADADELIALAEFGGF